MKELELEIDVKEGKRKISLTRETLRLILFIRNGLSRLA